MLRSTIILIIGLVLLTQSGCQTSFNQNNNKKNPQKTEQALEENMDKLNIEFLQAAEHNKKEEMAVLLEQGANINAVDNRGRTAAMIAVHTNELDLFQWLIDKGADINIRDNRSDNPLLYSGAEGLLDFVRAAVAAGADTKLTNRFGGTALIPAADRGHVDIVKELLKTSDVNIDHINNLGWTALLEAVLLGNGGTRHQQIVNLLIEYGADVNIADSEGVTPLQHAKRLGYSEMVQALEAAGGE